MTKATRFADAIENLRIAVGNLDFCGLFDVLTAREVLAAFDEQQAALNAEKQTAPCSCKLNVDSITTTCPHGNLIAGGQIQTAPGKCCQFGNFDEPHECAKQPGETCEHPTTTVIDGYCYLCDERC